MINFLKSIIETLAILISSIVNQNTPIPTVTPHPTVFASPVSTTKPSVKGVTDPIVTCNFKKIAPIKLPKSVCNASTECQIGDKWYYYDSVSKCKTDQDNYYKKNTAINNNRTLPPLATFSPTNNSLNTINCVVSYPCNGRVDTYQVDQSTCNYMQSGALSTCRTIEAMREMNNISNVNYNLVTPKPLDMTILQIDPAPTPLPYPWVK